MKNLIYRIIITVQPASTRTLILFTPEMFIVEVDDRLRHYID